MCYRGHDSKCIPQPQLPLLTVVQGISPPCLDVCQTSSWHTLNRCEQPDCLSSDRLKVNKQSWWQYIMRHCSYMYEVTLECLSFTVTEGMCRSLLVHYFTDGTWFRWAWNEDIYMQINSSGNILLLLLLLQFHCYCERLEDILMQCLQGLTILWGWYMSLSTPRTVVLHLLPRLMNILVMIHTMCQVPLHSLPTCRHAQVSWKGIKSLTVLFELMSWSYDLELLTKKKSFFDWTVLYLCTQSTSLFLLYCAMTVWS